MKRFLFCAVLGLAAAVVLLTACSGSTSDMVSEQTLPAPTALYAQIADAAALEQMITLTADELFDVIGIDPAWYTESAAYFSADGTSPHEVLIFLAVDASAAEALETVLQGRLRYKQDSAAQYLTENQPLLESGIVRRDGLTVSLLVTAEQDAVKALYP